MDHHERTLAALKRAAATRGKIRPGAILGSTVWFNTGGPAVLLFRPEDAEDLSAFLRVYEGAVLPLGAGSNVLIRDGGVDEAVIRLGRGFSDVRVLADGRVFLGAAVTGAAAAAACAEAGIAGLEFCCGIPGTIGGMAAMNAGAYGGDVASVAESAELILRSGEHVTLSAEELGYGYRSSRLPHGAVCTGVTMKGTPGADPAKIKARMAEIMAARAATQPVRGKTGGSTFKNPANDSRKAWQILDEAGCRGLRRGGAQFSELHCNFLLNTGGATSDELETLGEEARARAKAICGVTLEWEIKILGKKA